MSPRHPKSPCRDAGGKHKAQVPSQHEADHVARITMAMGPSWTINYTKCGTLILVGTDGRRYTQLPDYIIKRVFAGTHDKTAVSTWLDQDSKLHFLYSDGMKPVTQPSN